MLYHTSLPDRHAKLALHSGVVHADYQVQANLTGVQLNHSRGIIAAVRQNSAGVLKNLGSGQDTNIEPIVLL